MSEIIISWLGYCSLAQRTLPTDSFADFFRVLSIGLRFFETKVLRVLNLSTIEVNSLDINWGTHLFDLIDY